MSTRPVSEIAESAIFAGGLTNRLLCRLNLCGKSGAVFLKRILIAVGITWFPLVILSAIQGLAWGKEVQVPFFYSTDTLVRFLISFPLLIIAEKIIGDGIGEVVNYFDTSGVISEDNRPKLLKIVKNTEKFLQSVFPEALMLIAVLLTARIAPDIQVNFSPGITFWGHDPVTNQISLAGIWYKNISHPLYRFLVARWLWKYIIWIYFLFRVSRLRLTLTATHPDAAGGLGFLGITQMRFAILAFAISAQMSGYIARRMFFEGINLQSYEYVIFGLVALNVVLFTFPLFIFTPQLIASKRNGLIAYGVLAEKYTNLFERKWVGKNPKEAENILGTADIQSLADLGNSYELLRQMKPFPFRIKTVIFSLGLASAAPFLPLLLFVYKLDALLKQLAGFIL